MLLLQFTPLYKRFFVQRIHEKMFAMLMFWSIFQLIWNLKKLHVLSTYDTLIMEPQRFQDVTFHMSENYMNRCHMARKYI